MMIIFLYSVVFLDVYSSSSSSSVFMKKHVLFLFAAFSLSSSMVCTSFLTSGSPFGAPRRPWTPTRRRTSATPRIPRTRCSGTCAPRSREPSRTAWHKPRRLRPEPQRAEKKDGKKWDYVQMGLVFGAFEVARSFGSSVDVDLDGQRWSGQRWSGDKDCPFDLARWPHNLKFSKDFIKSPCLRQR